MRNCDTNARIYKEGADEFRDGNSSDAQISVKLQEAKIDKIIVCSIISWFSQFSGFIVTLAALCVTQSSSKQSY